MLFTSASESMTLYLRFSEESLALFPERGNQNGKDAGYVPGVLRRCACVAALEEVRLGWDCVFLVCSRKWIRLVFGR